MHVKGLRVRAGGKEILRGVTFQLSDGVNVLLGPNGSGKTTLLRAVIGMVKPLEGEVRVRSPISYVPAEFFHVQMKVLDVLLSGGRRGEYGSYLETLGVKGLIQRDFHALSSGEKKLILVAKALGEGKFVIMDEPTSNLDPRNQERLIRVVLSQRGRKDFLIATHDLDLAPLADNVVLLKEGRVKAFGPPEVTLTEAALSELYDARIRRVQVEGRTFFLRDL